MKKMASIILLSLLIINCSSDDDSQTIDNSNCNNNNNILQFDVSEITGNVSEFATLERDNPIFSLQFSRTDNVNLLDNTVEILNDTPQGVFIPHLGSSSSNSNSASQSFRVDSSKANELDPSQYSKATGTIKITTQGGTICDTINFEIDIIEL